MLWQPGADRKVDIERKERSKRKSSLQKKIWILHEKILDYFCSRMRKVEVREKCEICLEQREKNYIIKYYGIMWSSANKNMVKW